MARSSRGEQLSKAEKKRMFSTTMAVIEEDPTDVRARLQLVDLLQSDGRTDEAVEELQRTAAVYVDRGVPIKAVAVLRQAVKLAPQRADVRVTYGEVFESLRMRDDAAREYRQAVELFHTSGHHAAEIESLARLLALDDGNYGGAIQVAEALHRVGRTEQAADQYRRLSERLLETGDTAQWELIAERIAFLAPDDVTTAHDLALHYVRSGRHAEALGKLILCYQAEPNDVELLELVIDTLQHLGQTQHAATLTRRLVERYREGGLQSEADQALRRLHVLDPDDKEARRALGVLNGAMAEDSVLELQADEDLPSLEDLEDAEDGEIGFGGDFVDRLLSSGGQKKAPVLRNTVPPTNSAPAVRNPLVASAAPPLPVEAAPPIPREAAPPLPADIAPPLPGDNAPPLPDQTIEEDSPPTQLLDVVAPSKPVAAVPRRPLRPSSAHIARPSPPNPGKITTRARPGARDSSPQRGAPPPPAHRHAESAGFGPMPSPGDGEGATELLTDGAGRPMGMKATANAKMPRRAPPIQAAVAPQPARPSSPEMPPAMPQGPRPAPARSMPARPAPAPPPQPEQGIVAPGRSSPGIAGLSRPSAPSHRHADTSPTALQGNDTIDDAAAPALPRSPTSDQPPPIAAQDAVPPPIAGVTGGAAAPKAPTSTESTNLFLLEDDEEEGFGAQPEHTTIDPRVFEVLDRLDAKAGKPSRGRAPNDPPAPLVAASVPAQPAVETAEEPGGPRTLTPKRRSTKLPRPRLARGQRRSTSDSRRKRGIETDLKTLDFFIERGFYESAAALVGELEKRYPHSDELRARRRRIAQMARK